ncbi:18354_t:CDS:2, partial [Funneliformis geosporum]
KEHVKCKDHIEAEKLETARLPLRLLPFIIEMMKESGIPHISDAFGIMIDKSTDITTTKYLDIYASYVAKNRTFKTHFLCLLPLTDCDAETFASDGASVMLGKDEGIAAKLSRVCTYPLIVNHYVTHRLALA